MLRGSTDREGSRIACGCAGFAARTGNPAWRQSGIGTLNAERIDAACRAVDLEMTREEWFTIVNAMTGRVLP